MISSEHCQQYAVLLRIRRTAARRTSIFLGAVWGVGMFAAFLYYNIYSEFNSQSVFMITAMLIAFGLGLARQLARLDMFDQLLEMVDFLQRESRPG